ncbi:MAG: hypothetical protein K8S22_14410 [Betaproteobacteria bacterium]|nr:hypothetical protein [Betaproteobacteria bacterium]
MLGLTPLGTIHTAISLVAVRAGVIALCRDKEITSQNRFGKIYIGTTFLTCLTGFGIFQHGGFGKPHMLGILTLLTLGVAAIAGYSNLFGHASAYVATVSYLATFMIHWIPAVTETTTRLPLGAPLLPNADAPELKVVAAGLFVLFLLGAALQVRRIHGSSRLKT